MNEKIMKSVKVVAVASALAAVLTGCCLWSDDCGCKGEKRCCKEQCCESACCGKKTHGMNTSMTVGVGTDGIHAGGAANVGSHGVSAGAGGGLH